LQVLAPSPHLEGECLIFRRLWGGVAVNMED
jgi:hypothetical protein